MRNVLSIIVLILGFTTTGFAITIEINGNLANMSTFCAGDNIVLYCSNAIGVFTWSIPSLSLLISVNAVMNLITSMGFTAQRLTGDRSLLSFTATPELDNSTIMCINSANGSVLSTLDVEIYGPPSVPSVTISTTSYYAINILISPSGLSAVCVQNFSINITFMGMLLGTETVPGLAEKTVTFDNLNLRLYNYTIDVIATDLTGEVSEPYMEIATIALLTNLNLNGTSSMMITSGTDSVGGSGTSVGKTVGIVIGVVVFVLIVVGLIITVCIIIKRKKDKSRRIHPGNGQDNEKLIPPSSKSKSDDDKKTSVAPEDNKVIMIDVQGMDIKSPNMSELSPPNPSKL